MRDPVRGPRGIMIAALSRGLVDDGLGTSLLVARSPRKVVTLLRGVVETQ